MSPSSINLKLILGNSDRWVGKNLWVPEAFLSGRKWIPVRFLYIYFLLIIPILFSLKGLISAAQYYKSCRELLGDNFKKIFNELLVLLPDTVKQQELLSAHNDFRIKEKQSSNKSKKNKKNVWQTDSNSDLDCCICPTCKQVLTQQDVVTHKALHIEDEEFPSLQAISRIIS